MPSGDDSASMEDDPVPTLVNVLEVEGIAHHLTELAEPSVVALLASCSKATASLLATNDVWAGLLSQHFGVHKEVARELGEPKRSFAQRTICARWNLTEPSTPARQLHTPSTPQQPPLLMQSNSWSPDSTDSSGKENSPPPQRRRPLQVLQAEAGSMTTPATAAAPRKLQPCTVSRLREGLRQVMMSSPEGVTAFPCAPGDWSTWTARVTCPEDGSAVAGLEVRLSLCFPDDEATNGDHASETTETMGLPRVMVQHPVGLFHPNIDVRTGDLSALALSRRCSAIALVGEQLVAVADLLTRPAFDVAPSNTEAAAMWYGDRTALRARVRARAVQRESPEQRSSPRAGALPVLMRGLTM